MLTMQLIFKINNTSNFWAKQGSIHANINSGLINLHFNNFKEQQYII